MVSTAWRLGRLGQLSLRLWQELMVLLLTSLWSRGQLRIRCALMPSSRPAPCETPHPPRSLLPSSPKFPPSLNTAPPLGTCVWHQIIHRDPRVRGIAQWRYNRYHQDPKCLDPFLETTCEAGFYDIAIPEQSWPKFLQYGVMGDGFQVSHMPDNPKREHMEISRVEHDEQERKSG